ncbi:MAG: hypothetical protein HOO06_03470 [Bdellovibrionaceae bacterium]|nr:hypothetical protein [Pseudobdellovibrionaceae bacterium]
MKTFLIVVGIIIGAVVIITLGFVAYTVYNMVFISDISKRKLKSSVDYVKLFDGITVNEITPENAKPTSHEVSTGHIPAGKDYILDKNGDLREGRKVFDNNDETEVYVLEALRDHTALMIKRNEVFKVSDSKKSKKIGEYSNPKLKVIRHATNLNNKFFLVVGDPESSKYVDSRLWQVERETLSKKELTDDVYYSFSRPPKIFSFPNEKSLVLVYYVGSIDFAFGGDSSRPEFSVIRIYDEKYSEGIDVVKFGFKAGTIVDINLKNNTFTAMGDPSLPSMVSEKRDPERRWQIRGLTNKVN